MLPTIAYALLDAIALAETNSPFEYNQLANSSTFTGFDIFPEWEGEQFGEIRSYAAGRYRLEPATWDMITAHIGLFDFSPASQDSAAWWLAKHDYQMYTRRDLEVDLQNRNTRYLHAGLSKTWPHFNHFSVCHFIGAHAARGMLRIYTHQDPATPTLHSPRH